MVYIITSDEGSVKMEVLNVQYIQRLLYLYNCIKTHSLI